MFESERKQSIDQATVDAVVKHNAENLFDQRQVPVAGRRCGKDTKHGRLLMSAKSGMLECGACGFAVAP